MNGKLEFKSFLAKNTANFGLRCRVRMNICWTSMCNVYNEVSFLKKMNYYLDNCFIFIFSTKRMKNNL